MNAIDTNILLYRFDRREAAKRAKARVILDQLRTASEPTVVPWQVLGEFAGQLQRWRRNGLIPGDYVARLVETVKTRYSIILPVPAVLNRALDLTSRYPPSHWDSMLLGACLEAGVKVLYTEDMGSPATFDGLELKNPFV